MKRKMMRKRVLSLVMVVAMLLSTFLADAGTLKANAAESAGEHMVVVSPWAYNKGSIDNSQTYADGGYEYATIVPGGQVYYDKPVMKDVDMSIYSEFRFALKTNGSYWYEAGLVANNDYSLIAGANTDWREFSFKCETNDSGEAGFHMYKDGEATSTWLPADMNLSDLGMKFSSDTSALLYMTEVRGTLKEGANPSLKAVADSFNGVSGMSVGAEEPNFVATKSTKVKTSWTSTQSALTSVDLSSYDKIIFYARKAGRDDLTGYFESAQLGSFVISYNWTEFKLVKNTDSTWNIYTGGMLKQSNVAITNLSEITACYGENQYYFSEVFGVTDEEVTVSLQGEHMVVVSPWAYNKGSIDSSQTYADGGYEYATIVPGGQVYYDKPVMKDVDMSVYSEFRFALKTNGSYYYEAGLAANNDYSLIVGANSDAWREFSFKYETNDSGEAGFHMYKDGEATGVWLPADMNLSDLGMKFSANESALLYMTEVRGTLKEDENASLKVVADSFNGVSGMSVGAEEPNFVATKSTKVQTSHSYTQNPLADVDLSSYDKILFYARKTSSGYDTNAWLESNYLGSFVVTDNWTEFKLLRNEDYTWNVYVGGLQKQANLELTNLSDITATYGNDTYYFSEVFGVPGEKREEVKQVVVLMRLLKAKAAYQQDNNNFDKAYDLLEDGVIDWQDVERQYQDMLGIIRERMIVTSPWAYNKGTIDNSQTYTAGGYEYATIIPGGQVYYDKPLMKDVDLSRYSEVKFALKTNGSYWYEAGIAANNDFSMIAGANTDWREYAFKYETDDAGTPGYHMYKDGAATSSWLSADANLSELWMRFSADTNAELYITELRGELKDVYSMPLRVVASSFNTETGTAVSAELPNLAAIKSTEVKTSHSYTQNPLTALELGSYDKILFYARKASSEYNANAWLESNYLGSFVVTDNWTEFKLVKNADSTWNVYVGGMLKQENLSLTNLSDITATYGNDTYYFSEVFVVAD